VYARALTAWTDRFSFAAIISGRMLDSAILRKMSSSAGVHRLFLFSVIAPPQPPASKRNQRSKARDGAQKRPEKGMDFLLVWRRPPREPGLS
jgi:hypothetical protein